MINLSISFLLLLAFIIISFFTVKVDFEKF
jgi:hypothetical protein